ncbi:hypothetical protein [Allokutzneria sp. NRRL B-24872]|uniref:hypothetical protein n=1 Tax=Allokutzneria sp. NRRL B-24872 TaxID=1137961 RepID=UPI000A39D164|nr:hypothetical protein [Allokutzneria sp. NRRL B-24872]
MALIVSLVVVLLAGLGVGGWALLGGGAKPDAAPGGGKAEAKGLTEADIATADPRTLLTDSFMAFLVQPVQHTRMDKIWFGEVAQYLAGQEYEGDVIEGGFDYKQRKMNYLDDRDLCVDGAKRQLRSDGSTVDAGSCTTVKGLDWQSKVGNGLLPSGLTREQAQAFVDSLKEPQSFLGPGKPTTVSREGKRYVRLPVVFRSAPTSTMRAGDAALHLGLPADEAPLRPAPLLRGGQERGPGRGRVLPGPAVIAARVLGDADLRPAGGPDRGEGAGPAGGVPVGRQAPRTEPEPAGQGDGSVLAR